MGRDADRPGARARAWLLEQWFAPRVTLALHGLRPLAWLYGCVFAVNQAARRRQGLRAGAVNRPVVVVGNLVLGGAGKTPATIAIVQALQAAGYRPGVVSRGYGRRAHGLQVVSLGSDPSHVGDEPLLIHRRTGAPVVVARDRVAAARRVLELDPSLDIVVADDGLQHRQLQRDLEVVVFDERGIGNGLLLPAGPLREPFTASPGPLALVLYTHGQPSTTWPGSPAQRRLTGACRLSQWLAGRVDDAQPLSALRGRPLLAMAGVAVPERFFAALKDAGLDIRHLALPDHHRYDHMPWPAGITEVVTTEKDAVKLAPWADRGVTVWVVGLDLQLPADFVCTLLSRLPRAVAPTLAPLVAPTLAS